KLRKIYLYKFIFCILIALVFLPGKNIYAQEENTITDSVTVKKHSPIKAQLYSAILPGLGQIYNRKYWKLPIIYGIGGAVVFSYFYNRDYYQEYWDAYVELYSDPSITEYEFRGRTYSYSNMAQDFRRGSEYHRKWKDYALVGLAAVYLLNVIDAMIDAHFMEYDVSDDLSFKLSPSLINHNIYATTMGMKISLKF
ncbi:MAG: hypothetical protein JSV22_05160, partial [Bacteroidales bacterium]